MAGHLTTSRLAWGAGIVTALLVGLSAVGAPGTGSLRAAGGAALGPLERLLAPARDDELATLRAERDRLLEEVRGAKVGLAGSAQMAELLASPSASGARVVAARVVGVGRVGAAGPERLTIDVGSRDGVSVDQSVVGAGGLVGRVVSTAPWTADVALLGSPEVVVGVRVGSGGLIGSVGPAGVGSRGPRTPGQLGLELVGLGAPDSGDEVTTLGSVDGRPYPPGIPVGRVVSVDPPRGSLTATGAVEPAVDAGTLDIVAVLLSAPRVQPRPAVTGGVP